MTAARPKISHGMVLLVGIALGFGLASIHGTRLRAENSDRSGEMIICTGPIAIEENGQKIPIPQEAIYCLNHHMGTLLVTIPTYELTPTGTKVLTDFAERDLIKDFGIKPGMRPHFMMTTAALGARTQGWSPLYVFEVESGQVAVYQVGVKSVPGSSRPMFDLLDRRVDRRFVGKGIALAK